MISHTRLIELLRDTFPEAVFDEHDAHLGLGSFAQWDSLGNFNLLLHIEDAAGIRFDTEEISETKTLAAIIARLKHHGVYAQ